MSEKCPCGNSLGLRKTKWGKICGICDYKIEHGEWDYPTVQIINKFNLKLFQITFMDGSERFGYGKDLAEALRSIGLGSGSVSAISHYEVITSGQFRSGKVFQLSDGYTEYSDKVEDGL
jgi:hypothetical protein